MSTEPDALPAILDALYALPAGEFVTARDAQVRELRGHDRALAETVKGLRRPTAAAWALNHFVRRRAERVEELLAVGSRLRDAAASLDAEAIRALSRQRRQVAAALTVEVRRTAREDGERLSPAAAEQIEASLNAAMMHPAAAEALRAGHLVAAMRPEDAERGEVPLAVVDGVPAGHRPAASTGGDSGEAGTGARPELRVVRDPEALDRARQEAQAAIEQAAEALEQAREDVAEWEAEQEVLRARGMQVQARIDEWQRRIAEAETEAEEIEERRSETEAILAEAGEREQAAREEHDRAVKRWERIRD